MRSLSEVKSGYHKKWTWGVRRNSPTSRISHTRILHSTGPSIPSSQQHLQAILSTGHQTHQTVPTQTLGYSSASDKPPWARKTNEKFTVTLTDLIQHKYQFFRIPSDSRLLTSSSTTSSLLLQPSGSRTSRTRRRISLWSTTLCNERIYVLVILPHFLFRSAWYGPALKIISVKTQKSRGFYIESV